MYLSPRFSEKPLKKRQHSTEITYVHIEGIYNGVEFGDKLTTTGEMLFVKCVDCWVRFGKRRRA